MLAQTFLFAGCDRIYGILDKKGAEEMELVGEIVPFEENPTVKEIQTLLSVYGYNPGSVDGVLGFRTRDAIEKFQHDNSLEITRKADSETWNKMKYLRDRGWVDEGQINVMQIQELLNSRGYYKGKADGVFGPRTKKAVMDFQEDHELKVDGKVGYKTLNQMDKYWQAEEDQIMNAAYIGNSKRENE